MINTSQLGVRLTQTPNPPGLLNLTFLASIPHKSVPSNQAPGPAVTPPCNPQCTVCSPNWYEVDKIEDGTGSDCLSFAVVFEVAQKGRSLSRI